VQIDWFTFGAQILNFVLLVYLLKRFLYRPVLDAIAQREERIRRRLEEARRKEEEAEAEHRRFQSLQEDLERARADVLRSAEEEAERRRKELTEQVRNEVETIRNEWHESIRRQKETFIQELRQRMSRELYGLVERVLEELTGAELEDRIIDVFLARLPESREDERAEFLAAAREAEGRVRVRSSFPLSEGQRGTLARALSEWSDTDQELELDLQWEEDPSLTLGLEFQAGDRKMAWSADDYLDALQAETEEYLEAEAG